jgi:GATA-binding protein, other eukaryote
MSCRCGLYYKLHGSARPISMKSDVIRKRSRHDTRRGNPDTPSASPGVSRRASPVHDISPTLAPDSSTAQLNFDYNEEIDFRNTQSELLGALGQDLSSSNMFFPGPYNPDYLSQIYPMSTDPLPFPPVENNVETAELDVHSPRSNKRRRMSTDSASEPPSSSTSGSYSAFTDGYLTSASSATTHSQRSSMDFPFSGFLSSPNAGTTNPFNSACSPNSSTNGPALRGSGNTFWHPPMMPQVENSPQLFHPPMLPPADESPMDYLQAPMPHDDDMLFSTFFHPPMAVPEESNSHSVNNVHPPMAVDYAQHDNTFETAMGVY